MTRRVVITGLGIISPIGNNVNDFWSALLAGKNGVGRLTAFDASGFTLGGVTLGSGGGLDTLVGSDQDDMFVVDVHGLNTPDVTDESTQIVVAVGQSSADRIVIQGSGPILTQDDMNWVKSPKNGLSLWTA